MSHFANFVAVDWSGAAGARQAGIAVARCTRADLPPVLVRAGHCWSRDEVLEWLCNDLPPDSLVGLDLGMALPFVDAGAYFPGWDDSPPDARQLWALVDALCGDAPNLEAGRFVDHPVVSAHFRRHGGRTGAAFPPGRGRLRVTEQRQRDQGLNPYSNLNLVGAAQVGKSSLTGMRMLHRLDRRIAVWPFDDWPARGSVVVEIYTTIAAIAAGRVKGRSKMRDPAALDAALKALGSPPHRLLARYDDHITDALLAAAWLRTVADDVALRTPAASRHVLANEGWTYGIH